MQKTSNPQINTRTYWNHIYSDETKRDGYWDRTQRFYKTLEYVKNGDKFLDIGCGIGTMCNLIKETYPEASVWGVDIASEAIEENKRRMPGIKFYSGHVGQFEDLPEGYFDVIFAGEILEHLDNPRDLYRDAKRFLKKGGTFICTTPLENHIDSPEHTWYFEKKDIEKLCKDNGFTTPDFIELPDMESSYVIYSVAKKK